MNANIVFSFRELGDFVKDTVDRASLNFYCGQSANNTRWPRETLQVLEGLYHELLSNKFAIKRAIRFVSDHYRSLEESRVEKIYQSCIARHGVMQCIEEEIQFIVDNGILVDN